MSHPSFDHAHVTELALGAKKTFENAHRLYREARILASVGAHERALFLHQISLEECAKVEKIGWMVASLLLGLPFDQEKWLSSLASHASKNRTNAYALNGTDEERSARLRGDWEAARLAFRKFQADFHQESNRAKNSALYTDLRSGKFVSPSDQITQDMLVAVLERNETLLEFTGPGSRLLEKIGNAPGKYYGLLAGLPSHMEEICNLDSNPWAKAKALEQLLLDAIGPAIEEDSGPLQ